MIKARIEKDANSVFRVFVQRGKFKHWFILGRHKETDTAFERGLKENGIEWEGRIREHGTIFSEYGN